MTIRIPANRLLAVVLVLVMVFTGLLIAASRNVLVYPTPDAQSKFLKADTPKHVICRFDLQQGSEIMDGESSDAHRGFATHQRLLEYHFVTGAHNETVTCY